jgi:hypothetical protein
MKTNRFSLLLACLTALSFFLASCGGGEPALAGKWRLIDGSSIPEDVELLKDGSGLALGRAVAWKTENTRFYILHPDLALAFDYELSGSTLRLTNDEGEKFIYVKEFGGAAAIVGSWELVSVTRGGEKADEEKWVYTFNKDGTGAQELDEESDEFKWVTDNDILYHLYEAGNAKQSYTYKIEGGTLTLSWSRNVYGDNVEFISEFRKK